ncbi:MAG: SPASM domain-containing protein, partial [Lachnospiraceae bacterium]|nr:SPASM domain-containing protein [Lachnospiraceae bacterium]
EYIPEYYNDNMPIDIDLGGYFSCAAGRRDYSIPFDRKALSEQALDRCRYCVEGNTRIFISPEGKVYPCMGFSETALKDKMPSLLEESFANITRDSSYREMVNTTLKSLKDACRECADCEHFPVCRGGCMLNGMTAAGNFLVPDPSACYFYKNVGVSRVHEVASK